MSDLSAIVDALNVRSDGSCELCGSPEGLHPVEVGPSDATDVDHAVLLCGTCGPQVRAEQDLDPKHWFCLQGAIWSEVPAVQVVSWRLLQRLSGETWAVDLAEQAYLADEVLAWAQQGVESEPEGPATVDSNGTVLSDGDSVTLIKDLDVKGAGFTAKRGTLVKNIRLSEDPGLVEGRVNKTAIFLKTEFLKKA